MSKSPTAATLPRVDLINLDRVEFEGLPFVLTSPRSLEACRRLGIEPVSLLAQPVDALRSRMPDIPAPALATMADRLEADRRCRLRQARLERERIIDEEAGALEASTAPRLRSVAELSVPTPPALQYQSVDAVNFNSESHRTADSHRFIVVDNASTRECSPRAFVGSDRCLNRDLRGNDGDLLTSDRRCERRFISGSEPQLDAWRRTSDYRSPSSRAQTPVDDKVTTATAYGIAAAHCRSLCGSEPQLFRSANGGSGLRRRDSGRKRLASRMNSNRVAIATKQLRGDYSSYGDVASSQPRENNCQPPMALLQKLELVRLERFQASSDRRRRLESEIDDFRREMRRLRLLAERRTLDAAERGLRAMRVA